MCTATLRTIALAHREISTGDQLDPESLESDLVLDAVFGNIDITYYLPPAVYMHTYKYRNYMHTYNNRSIQTEAFIKYNHTYIHTHS